MSAGTGDWSTRIDQGRFAGLAQRRPRQAQSDHLFPVPEAAAFSPGWLDLIDEKTEKFFSRFGRAVSVAMRETVMASAPLLAERDGKNDDATTGD